MKEYKREWTKPPYRSNTTHCEASDLRAEVIGIQHPVSCMIEKKGTAYDLFKIPRAWTGDDTSPKGIATTGKNHDNHLYARLTHNRIGEFRGRTLVIYDSEDLRYSNLSNQDEARAEAHLANERLHEGHCKQRATRLGNGYLISKRQSGFVERFQDTAFSVEKIKTEKAASVQENADRIRGFTDYRSAPMYQIKDEDGRIVGGIRDRAVISYDKVESHREGKTPRMFNGSRPTHEENYGCTESLDDLLQGRHSLEDDATIVQNPPIAAYSGVNNVKEEIVAEQFN